MQIEWSTDLAAATQRAREERKTLFLDVAQLGCRGCAAMDFDVFTHAEVARMLDELFVPVRLDFQRDRAEVRRRHVIWTPTIVAETPSQIVLRAHAGYLPARDLVPWLRLASAHAHIRAARYDVAADELATLAEAWPAEDVAPEALYWRGMALYLARRDHAELDAAWETLRRRWPRNSWARRTDYLAGADESVTGHEDF